MCFSSWNEIKILQITHRKVFLHREKDFKMLQKKWNVQRQKSNKMPKWLSHLKETAILLSGFYEK